MVLKVLQVLRAHRVFRVWMHLRLLPKVILVLTVQLVRKELKVFRV